MGEFNTVGLEDIIDAFSRREAATVEAVPKMLKAGADVLIEAQRAEAQAMGLNLSLIHILKGNSKERRLLPFLYMIDDVEKWNDIDELKKANPNMGCLLYTSRCV